MISSSSSSSSRALRSSPHAEELVEPVWIPASPRAGEARDGPPDRLPLLAPHLRASACAPAKPYVRRLGVDGDTVCYTGGLAVDRRRARHRCYAAKADLKPSCDYNILTDAEESGETSTVTLYNIIMAGYLGRLVKELQEALDVDIQDHIMKEWEMQRYIPKRGREVAERKTTWKAELSRREVL